MGATATFIVCWTLLYGHPGQENCTPGMAYDQAQMVMTSILKTGDSYRDLSMRLDAKVALTNGLAMGGGTGSTSRMHGIPLSPNLCQ